MTPFEVILSLVLREHRVPFYSLQTSFIPFQCVPVRDPLQKLSHQQEAPETALWKAGPEIQETQHILLKLQSLSLPAEIHSEQPCLQLSRGSPLNRWDVSE